MIRAQIVGKLEEIRLEARAARDNRPAEEVAILDVYQGGGADMLHIQALPSQTKGLKEGERVTLDVGVFGTRSGGLFVKMWQERS